MNSSSVRAGQSARLSVEEGHPAVEDVLIRTLAHYFGTGTAGASTRYGYHRQRNIGKTRRNRSGRALASQARRPAPPTFPKILDLVCLSTTDERLTGSEAGHFRPSQPADRLGRAQNSGQLHFFQRTHFAKRKGSFVYQISVTC